MTTEQLLKEAIFRYPIGTKYRSANPCSTCTYTVEKQSFQVISLDMVYGESGKETLYRDGKWAKVIEMPIIHYEIY